MFHLRFWIPFGILNHYDKLPWVEIYSCPLKEGEDWVLLQTWSQIETWNYTLWRQSLSWRYCLWILSFGLLLSETTGTFKSGPSNTPSIQLVMTLPLLYEVESGGRAGWSRGETSVHPCYSVSSNTFLRGL